MSHVKDDNIILRINKDEFATEYVKINDVIKDYVKEKKVKEINVVYIRYNSVSDIAFERKKLFPVELDETLLDGIDTTVDYVVETDIDEFISSVMVLCICYQIKIFEANSWASENVMRERVTRESMKKIDEIETEKARQERKEKKQKAFKKQISNYRILKG
jgi:F0F1-type ATP synthase gamma subunit